MDISRFQPWYVIKCWLQSKRTTNCNRNLCLVLSWNMMMFFTELSSRTLAPHFLCYSVLFGELWISSNKSRAFIVQLMWLHLLPKKQLSEFVDTFRAYRLYCSCFVWLAFKPAAWIICKAKVISIDPQIVHVILTLHIANPSTSEVNWHGS